MLEELKKDNDNYKQNPPTLLTPVRLGDSALGGKFRMIETMQLKLNVR